MQVDNTNTLQDRNDLREKRMHIDKDGHHDELHYVIDHLIKWND